MVEFALIVPVLAFLALGLLDFGRIFYSYMAVINAAREGARFCALNPNASDAELAKRVTDSNVGELGQPFQEWVASGRVQIAAWVTPAGTVPSGAGSTACPMSGEGDQVTVRVTVDFKPVTPFISNITGNPKPVSATAVMTAPPA